MIINSFIYHWEARIHDNGSEYIGAKSTPHSTVHWHCNHDCTNDLRALWFTRNIINLHHKTHRFSINLLINWKTMYIFITNSPRLLRFFILHIILIINKILVRLTRLPRLWNIMEKKHWFVASWHFGNYFPLVLITRLVFITVFTVALILKQQAECSHQVQTCTWISDSEAFLKGEGKIRSVNQENLKIKAHRLAYLLFFFYSSTLSCASKNFAINPDHASRYFVSGINKTRPRLFVVNSLSKSRFVPRYFLSPSVHPSSVSIE